MSCCSLRGSCSLILHTLLQVHFVVSIEAICVHLFPKNSQTGCFEPLHISGFQMISKLWGTESLPSPAATPWPKHCTLPRCCCRPLLLPSPRVLGCTRPRLLSASVSGAVSAANGCTNPGEVCQGKFTLGFHAVAAWGPG